MAIPTLLSEEFQFEDTGVTLNTSPALPFVDINSIDGIDSTSIRLSTSVREGMHGAWVDAEFEDARVVILDCTAYASPTALETYLDTLKANFAPSATIKPLYFGTDVGMRQVFGKSIGLRYQKSSMRRLGQIDFQAQVLCEDPRIYSPTIISQVIPGTLTLLGNRDSVGTITIAGARTNPVITLGTSVITFALVIASGETVVIDLNARTIIKDGTINVRGNVAITGGWPQLVNGANVFTVGGTGSGTITVAARSAWR